MASSTSGGGGGKRKDRTRYFRPGKRAPASGVLRSDLSGVLATCLDGSRERQALLSVYDALNEVCSRCAGESFFLSFFYIHFIHYCFVKYCPV